MADVIITKLDEYSSSTNIEVCVEAPSGYGYYEFLVEIYDTDGELLDQRSLSSTSCAEYVVFSDLTPNTAYIIKAGVTCKSDSSANFGAVFYGELATSTLPHATGGSDYTPDLSSVTPIQDDESTTTSQVGIKVVGLDSYYGGTWKLEISVLYGTSGSSVVTKTESFSGGVSESPTIVFDGLSQGTAYDAYGSLQYVVSDVTSTYSIDPFTVTTDEPDDSYYPDLDKIDFVVTSLTQTSITVHLTGLDTKYSASEWMISWYLWTPSGSRVDSNLENYVSAGASTSEPVEFTGLDQNTDYDLEARITYRYAGEDETVSKWFPFKTGTSASYVPDMENEDLEVKDVSAPTDTSLKVYVEGLDAAYSGTWEFEWQVFKYNSDDDSSTYIKSVTSSDSGSRNKSSYVTITGLDEGTTYVVGVYVTATVQGVSYTWYAEGMFGTSGNVSPEDTYGGAQYAFLVLEGADDGTWISAHVAGLDTSYAKNDRVIHWYVDGVLQTDSTPISPYVSSTQDDPFIIWTTPGETYTVQAVVVYEVDDLAYEYPLPEQQFTTASTADKWTVYVHGPYTNLSREQSLNIGFSAGYVARIGFTCAHDGTVTIYSEGSIDVIGYLSDSTIFDTSTGVPDSVLVRDDDSGSGNNFSLTYDVTAGIRYYLYFRCFYIDETGSSVVYIVPPSAAQRPDYFEWDNPKVSGGDFNITASEWGRLLDNINAVREYKGLSAISDGSTVGYFLYPVTGDDFLALHYNQALNGITGILGTGYNTNAVYVGDDVTAAKINLLRDMINDIE